MDVLRAVAILSVLGAHGFYLLLPVALWPGLKTKARFVTTLFRPGGGFVVNAPETFFARTFRFNLVSLGFALLLPAASRWTLARENVGSLAVRRIAIRSYSMYLVHQPVIQLVDRHLFAGWQTSFPQAAASFGTQEGGTILISALVYRFYEAPITRLRDGAAPRVVRWLGSREKPAARVGAETVVPATKS